MLKNRIYMWLALSVLAAISVWIYTHRVLVPWEYQVNIVRGNLRAQLGEIYPRWVGARNLLLDHRNPYAPEVTREIQIAYYGRPIQPGELRANGMPVDEQRFAYPVYVSFLLAPTLHMNFNTLQHWAEPFLGLLIIASVLIWMSILQWRPPNILTAAIVVFVIFSPQIVQGLRFRQLGLLVGFLVACATWCATRNYLAWAGVLLAFSTIKPQMMVLPLIWFLLWAASDLQTRWRFPAGFLGAMAILIGAGEFFQPGWIKFFLQGIPAYARYFPTYSLLEIALGNRLGDVVASLMFVIILIFSWSNRQVAANSPAFLSILSCYLFITTIGLRLIQPSNQVLLLLPALWILRDWENVRTWGQRLFLYAAGWPYVVALIMIFCMKYVQVPSRMVLLPSFVSPLFPLVLIAVLAVAHREPDPPLPAPSI